MTTSATPFVPALNSEPIAGYVLKNRLGSGGAGEVWRAEAPGGLPKAIKFVYGTLDEKRASQELKSLNRIKEVHHPFLLSLERIEVVDGHLIIVSELASGCLKDRFEQCRKEGLDGIPREELLGYLRDAADVLDFIYDKHSLQHLDIKPENLLLLGNHIKVADFGLLKNVHELTESMVGGLTPMYAPPEVLCGRPSRYSDQYSLAIVFQEMLTGQTPFEGRNTAQLAAQHLHSSPAIHCLPPGDQAVISRALSKKPEARFPNCRALIENLYAPPSRPVSVSTSNVRAKLGDVGRVAKTEMLGGEAAFALPGAGKQLLPTTSNAVRALDRIELTGNSSIAYRPTVFVGVGGTGVKILQHLLRRLNSQWGNLNDVPAVQMLMLDTDRQALAELSRGNTDVSNYGVSSVAIPLRATSDYRSESHQLLEWISRRWLFNIPRSQLTEGMRPLGRLAFVDHSETIIDRLRKLVGTAVASSSVVGSSLKTGLDFQSGPPRIFVVSSLAGGTGGGIVLDLAYAIRKVLAELSLPDDGVCGLLTHSTSRNPSQRDLAVVNTCSALCELIHYSKIGSYYPGDSACDLPPFYENNATFHDAYLVNMGEGLSENEYDGAVDQLAEYLYHNVATPAAAYFDAGRMLEHETNPAPLSNRKLRTLGITRYTASVDKLRQAEEAQLCLELAGSWLPFSQSLPQCAHNSNQALVEAAVTAFVSERRLTLEETLNRAAEFVGQLTNHGPEQLVQHMVSHMVGPANQSLSKVDLMAAIDTMFQHGETRTDNPSNRHSLYSGVVERLRAVAHEQGAAVKSWLVKLVDVPGYRIQGAVTAAKRLAATLEEVQAQTRMQVDKAESLLRERQGDVNPQSDLRALLMEYGITRLQQLMHRAIQVWVAGLMNHVNAALGEIRNINAQANNLLDVFQRSQQTNSLSPDHGPISSDDVWMNFVKNLRQRALDLVQEADVELNRQLEQSKTSFSSMLLEPNVHGVLLDCIRKVAHNVLRRAMQSFQQVGSTDLALVNTLHERLQATTPKFLACGGATRLVMVAPGEIDSKQMLGELEAQVGQPLTLVEANTDSIVLCQEVEQVPLENVLAQLIGSRADYLEAARRLHTRVDVNWSLV